METRQSSRLLLSHSRGFLVPLLIRPLENVSLMHSACLLLRYGCIFVVVVGGFGVVLDSY